MIILSYWKITILLHTNRRFPIHLFLVVYIDYTNLPLEILFLFFTEFLSILITDKMGDENLKQRKPNQTISNDSNKPLHSTNSSVSSAVIQSKDEYFDSLRIWLQQVQLHQAIVQYFPYYLAANYQQSLHGTQPSLTSSSTATSMPNLFSSSTFFNQQQTQQNGAINGNEADHNIPQQAQPVFIDNLFQQNPNNFNDSTRRNLEGYYANKIFRKFDIQIVLKINVLIESKDNALLDTFGDKSKNLLKIGIINFCLQFLA